MSLIVLQLTSGDETGDASISEALCEVLTTLRSAGEWQPDAGREQEPMVVVPEDDRLWRGEDPRLFVDAGQVVLAAPRVGEQSVDQRIGGALRRAFDRALDHRATVQRTSDPAVLDRPAIMVVPILVLGDEKLGAEEILRRLAELERVSRWLDRAADEISQGALARHNVPSLDLGVTITPWIYLSHPPPPQHLPAALFAGSVGVGARHASPLVYTGTASDGRRRTWEEYGCQRLLTDLYFLHGLSGSRSEVERLFPVQIDDGERRLYTLHSALFEYPLDELLSGARLVSLLAAEEGRLPVLPDPHRLEDLADSAKARIKDPLELLSARLTKLLDSGLQEDEFAFEGSYMHRPVPEFRGHGPAENRWQTWVDDAGWPLVAPERHADKLHSDVVLALRRSARGALDARMDEALSEARGGVEELLHDAEAELGAQLEAKTWGDAEGPAGRTPTALGSALALLHGLKRSTEACIEEPEPPPGVEQVLQDLVEEREAWISEEAALLEKGGKQPSLGGFWLVLVCLALAVLALAAAAFVVLPLAIATLVVGAAVVFLLGFRSHRRLRKYWDSWKELAERYLARANASAAALVAPLKHRVRQVKVLALQDLLRAIGAAERRFLVELRGLVGMVKAEQSLLARKHGARQDGKAAVARGLFRFLPEVKVESINSDSLDAFHLGLAELLKQALRLGSVPGRIPVREYEDLISRLVAPRDEVRVEKAHADEACMRLEACVRSGVNPSEASDVGILTAAVDPVTYAIVGRRLNGRLGKGLQTALDATSIPWSRCFVATPTVGAGGLMQPQAEAVLRAFAPEIAVVVQIGAWRVPPASGAEVSHG